MQIRSSSINNTGIHRHDDAEDDGSLLLDRLRCHPDGRDDDEVRGQRLLELPGGGGWL